MWSLSWKIAFLKWNANKASVDEINDHPGGGWECLHTYRCFYVTVTSAFTCTELLFYPT